MNTPEMHVHVEQLLGRRVRDLDGRIVGRLQELKVEVVDGDFVVTEFHIGPAALLERIAGFVTQLPFLRRLPVLRWEYRVAWTAVDLSTPRSPRLLRRRSELQRMPPEQRR